MPHWPVTVRIKDVYRQGPLLILAHIDSVAPVRPAPPPWPTPTPARVRLWVTGNVGPLFGADCKVDNKVSRLSIARLNVALFLKIRPDSVLDARCNQRI